MTSKLKIFAAAAALAVVSSGSAFAYGPCVPGYAPYHGVCRPMHVNNYHNPVSGALTGEAHGAAQGYGSSGPVGAVVGGALGAASGTLQGTANMLSGR